MGNCTGEGVENIVLNKTEKTIFGQQSPVFGSRWDAAGSAVSDNRYRYNGKELQTTGGLNYLDYGARMYDARLGRWHSLDLMSEKYLPVSPFAYCLNNPVNYTDPNGMWIVGTDGKRVYYSALTGFSSNASADVRRIGNALLRTNTGTERLKFMISHNEKVSLAISSEVMKNGNGDPMLGIDNRTGNKMNSDGTITVGEHKITIYEGTIKDILSNPNSDYKGLTMNETIGAIAGHESGHVEKENTKQSYENDEDRKRNRPERHNIEIGPNKIEKDIINETKDKKQEELEKIRNMGGIIF